MTIVLSCFKRIVITFLLCSSLYAQTSAFHFNPKKIQAGIAYHYVKTEKDGTNPENISIYVAAPERLEVFKFHEPGTRAGLVLAKLDYQLFQVNRLESYAVTGVDEKCLVATMDFDAQNNVANVVVTANGPIPEKTPIGFVPFHVYNFDLTSLNFMMRHLVNPEGRFKVGIADPNFTEQGPLFVYRGEVEIKYVSEEEHDGVLCRRYDIDGSGVLNRGGSIWVRKDGEYFQEVIMDLPDNPSWQSFRLTLKNVEPMSSDSWQKFMSAHFQKTP